MFFFIHTAILANNDSSATVTETVFSGHDDLSVQSQQSRIDSTLMLSPSQLNSSKLWTGRRHVTTRDLLVRLTNRLLLVFNNKSCSIRSNCLLLMSTVTQWVWIQHQACTAAAAGVSLPSSLWSAALQSTVCSAWLTVGFD